ncbi:MAG: AraC family transcriptional regulator [Lactobacillus sp.]|nr:AraC family transcriptional regulator [Lactobacillus sp.]
MFRHEIIITQGILPFRIVIHRNSVIQITKHWHQSLEIDFTVHGDGDYFVSGKKTHLKDGDFIVINSGEVHGVENISPGNKRRSLTLLIPAKTMKKLVPNIDNYYFLAQNSDIEKNKAVRDQLFAIYYLWTKKDHKYAQIEVLGHFYLLFSYLLDNFLVQKSEVLTFNEIKKQDKVKEIINYLSQNFTEDLTLSEIAAHFGFSKNYLDRLFKKEVHTSLMHYLQLIRLQYAYQEIANTNLPINVIADHCGFANVKSLQKLFKKFYQTTPKKYRKQQEGQ